MSLSGFALRYKPIVVTMVALLMLWGAMSYMTMPRREDPEYIVRSCQVLTNWPGTPTEKVEELVTYPLEQEINTLDGIRWVRSETTVGVSSIIVELDRPTPGEIVEQMWDKVRSRVERVSMPEDGIVPLVIDDYGDTNVMVMALYQTPLPGDDAVREENRYTGRQLDIFADRLKDELKLLPGVAKVVREGVREEAIYIETDLGKWTQLALTTTELEQLVARRNVIAPGGIIDTDVGRFSVKPTGDLDAVSELDSVIVGATGDDAARAPVYMNDLDLNVVRDYQDPLPVIARFGAPGVSEPCVVVAFAMKDGANIVAVCALARDLLHRLTVTDKILPPDIAITSVSDQSLTVTRKIDDFIANVVGAVLIVVIIVYLMVGFRSAAVMAGNIPLVIVGSIAIITLFDIQLEQISLAAMIIALGMLVDNAVQICDQARRLQSEGMTPAEAALKGSDQLAFPILIATGTTIAAFYPMLIGLQGSTKEYIFSLPMTITVTLALSYVIAMTFCTLLAFWFIRPPKDPNESLSPVIKVWQKVFRKRPAAVPVAVAQAEDGEAVDGAADDDAAADGAVADDAVADDETVEAAPAGPQRETGLYPALVRTCIKARFLVILGSFALLAFVLTLPVGSEFFPQDLRNQFAVEVWLPEGSSIEETDAATHEVEDIIRALSPHTDAEGNAVERLEAMAVIVGKGQARWYLGRNPESPKASYAEIVVKTTDPMLTSAYVKEIRSVAAAGSPERGIEPALGARVIPRELAMGPAVDAPIGVRIFGSGFADLNVMKERAEGLTAAMRAQPGTWDVYDSWGSSAYQLRVNVDEDKANLAGVSNLGLAQSLNAYFSGHYLTTFREGDHQVPVYLRAPADQRGSLTELRSAYVEGLYGKVPLDAVAKLEPRWEQARIDRRFLNRVIEVRARVEDGYRANDIVLGLLDSEAFKEWDAAMPPGYTWEVGGELFESKQAQGELQLSLLLSVLMIILLLIIQYNGVAKPIIILTTLPLALIGALGGLYITGYPLGFMPQLGVLSLFGIVVNTAIIFIEFADTLIKERAEQCDGSGPIMGLTVEEFRECLVKAGQVRLLPIAMTTLTTIGGLLPLALAGGPMWEGMAWLMIFGLIVATLLTLVIVPALYAVFVENFKMKPVVLEEDAD